MDCVAFVNVVSYAVTGDAGEIEWDSDIRPNDGDMGSDEIHFNAASPSAVPEVPAGALAPVIGLIGAGVWFVRRRVKK